MYDYKLMEDIEAVESGGILRVNQWSALEEL